MVHAQLLNCRWVLAVPGVVGFEDLDDRRGVRLVVCGLFFCRHLAPAADRCAQQENDGRKRGDSANPHEMNPLLVNLEGSEAPAILAATSVAWAEALSRCPRLTYSI